MPRLIASLALMPVLVSLTSTAGLADCTCRYDGGDVQEGELACISTAQGRSLARCEKVQNVSSWKILNQPCDAQQSGMDEDIKPAAG